MVRKVKIHIRLSHTYTTTSREFCVAMRWALFSPVLGPEAALSQMLLTEDLFLSDATGDKRTGETRLDIGGAPFPGQRVTEVSPPITNLGGQHDTPKIGRAHV